MPVTFTFPQVISGAPVLGLGGSFDATSSVGGGDRWVVRIYLAAEPTAFNVGIQWNKNDTGIGSQHFTVDPRATGEHITSNSSIPLTDGATVHVNAELRDGPTTVVDSGTTDVTWRPEAFLHIPITQPVGGGLTTSQAAQLTQVETNTNAQQTQWTEYQEVTLPSLNAVLTGITTAVTATIGAGTSALQATVGQILSFIPKGDVGEFNPSGGTTCDRIDWNIGGAAYFGMSVLIDAYPDSWVWTTPDENWSVRDLAVLTITRGGVIERRWGIHSRSFSLENLPDMLPVQLANVGIPVAPGDYHIIVDWAPDVCGHIVLYTLP